MDETEECCACLDVAYNPEEVDGRGLMRERWTCRDCGAEFKRLPVIESLRAQIKQLEAENERLEMYMAQLPEAHIREAQQKTMAKMAEALKFTITGHNLLRWLGYAQIAEDDEPSDMHCNCDPDVGHFPCESCAARTILARAKKALELYNNLKGKKE